MCNTKLHNSFDCLQKSAAPVYLQEKFLVECSFRCHKECILLSFRYEVLIAVLRVLGGRCKWLFGQAMPRFSYFRVQRELWHDFELCKRAIHSLVY